MIKLNRYLRELGYNENSWLFNKANEHDDRYQEDEEGFKNAEFFNLDECLSMYIYSQLCYFRDYCLVGYPSGLTAEKWKDIIDKMIEAFKILLTQTVNEYTALSKNQEKKVRYGLRLFIKYYRHLWY